MTRIIAVIKPDNTTALVSGPKGIDQLQSAVGGWIERVNIPHSKGSVYVNEEGLMRGLPYNTASDRIGYPNLMGNIVLAFEGRDVTQADVDKLLNPTEAQLTRMRKMFQPFM